MYGAQMKFELREASPGFLVLTFRGGLSWEEHEQLAVSVEEHLAGRHSVHGLVLDMSHVEFVNSTGLGALFQLAQRLRQRDGQLAFASVPPTLQRLFAAVGMDRLAKIGGSVSEVLETLAEPAPT